MTSAATSSLPIDQSKLVPGHPEAWAPLLLQSLITHGVTNISTQPEAVYLPWARARRLRAGDYGPLLGMGSWNHQIMIEAALAWSGDSDAIEWLCQLLEWQLGLRQPAPGQPLSLLSYLGGSEPLSCEYEMFRVGSFASLALLASRFPSHPQAKRVTDLVARYCACLVYLLNLGATPWRDESQFKGAAGPWYTGLMISPVGERSAVGHSQNDLGPFLSLALGRTFVSKREDWPMQVVRMVPPLFSGFKSQSSIADIANIKLWAPTHWMQYDDGSCVVWKPSRQNGNTTCILFSVADASTHTMTLGYPWPADRTGARHTDGSGSCAIEGNRVVARYNDSVSAATLPDSEITSIWHADQDGMRKER